MPFYVPVDQMGVVDAVQPEKGTPEWAEYVVGVVGVFLGVKESMVAAERFGGPVVDMSLLNFDAITRIANDIVASDGLQAWLESNAQDLHNYLEIAVAGQLAHFADQIRQAELPPEADVEFANTCSFDPVLFVIVNKYYQNRKELDKDLRVHGLSELANSCKALATGPDPKFYKALYHFRETIAERLGVPAKPIFQATNKPHFVVSFWGGSRGHTGLETEAINAVFLHTHHLQLTLSCPTCDHQEKREDAFPTLCPNKEIGTISYQAAFELTASRPHHTTCPTCKPTHLDIKSIKMGMVEGAGKAIPFLVFEILTSGRGREDMMAELMTDLPRRWTPQALNTTYELSGITCHVDGDHYVMLCPFYNPSDNKDNWYLYDGNQKQGKKIEKVENWRDILKRRKGIPTSVTYAKAYP